MEDKIIKMIYENIKNVNFYNYDNNEKLKKVNVIFYENICNEKVIDIALEHEVYTIHCFKSFADSEVEESV